MPGKAKKPAPPAAVLPYDETAWDPHWLGTLNAWTWNEVSSGRWQASGTCPRCAHPTTVEVEATVMLDVAPEVAPALPRRPPATVTFRCTCGTVHAAGKTGCGLRLTGMKGLG